MGTKATRAINNDYVMMTGDIADIIIKVSFNLRVRHKSDGSRSDPTGRLWSTIGTEEQNKWIDGPGPGRGSWVFWLKSGVSFLATTRDEQVLEISDDKR